MSSVPLNLSAREIVAPFGSRPVADDEFVLFRVAELGNMDANYGLGYINKHQIGVITEFEAAKVSANVGGLDGLRRLGLDKILQVSQNMMYRALVRDKVFSDKVVFRILESVDTGEGLEDFNGSIRFVVLGITKNFKANRKPKELAEKIAESAREGKGIGRGVTRGKQLQEGKEILDVLYGQDVLFQTTMRANATIRISKDMVERKDVKSKLSTTHYKDLLAKIDKNVAKKILPRITLVPRTDPKEYTTTMVPYLRARFAHTGPAARHRDPDVTNEQNKIDAARKANKKRQRKD